MSYATSSDQSQMMAQSPSPANVGAVPDLVKIGQIPTNTAIDIETDILDPVVHTDTFCRFQLQNKGILHSNSKIIADYQYFPQEMMEQYAQQNANLSFTYSDYRLAKRTVDISASNASSVTAKSTGQLIVNVGGAGRLVTKVFTTLSDDNVKKASMLNNYHSMGLFRDYDNATQASRYNGVLTSNVKYNDHFLYPIDVNNSAQQFHYLVQGEGMVPFINREEYNFEGQGLSSGTFEGYSMEGYDPITSK
jgi:hypothetical protein